MLKEPQNHKHDQKQDRANKKRNRTLDEWRDLVQSRIEEAMEQGAFDNLPGAGKPQDLRGNPNEPTELRMAHKLLKNNNLAPGWILDRKGLIEESEAFRREIERKWRYYKRLYRGGELADEDADEEGSARPTVEELRSALEHEWREQIERWDEQLVDLNRRILELNLGMPIWRMELMRVNLDRELQRHGGRRTLDDDARFPPPAG